MKHNKTRRNIEVPLTDIKPNVKNPRKDYNKRELEELKSSLQSMGQIHNIVIDDKGVILAGHRRYFCAKELGWNTIRADIKTGLTSFEKSALMISSNVTQKHFNAWDNREAIARIYWDEFLEEYPVNDRDKGYSAFARHLGLSSAYVGKIIEFHNKENEPLLERFKKANIKDMTVIDTVLSAKKDLRPALTRAVVDKAKIVNKFNTKNDVRDFVRALKRKLNRDSLIHTHKASFPIWIREINKLGYELDDEVIQKGKEEDLKKLKTAIEKNIIKFYEKLCKIV